MQVYYGNNYIPLNASLSFDEAQGEFSFTWKSDPSKYHSVLLYDDTVDIIHYAVVNIPDMNITSGRVIINYTPPSPPTGTHTYFLLIYEQDRYETQSMDLSNIVSLLNTQRLIDKFIFTVSARVLYSPSRSPSRSRSPPRSQSPSRTTSPAYTFSRSGSPTPKELYFKTGSPLNERQQAYCRCVAHKSADPKIDNPYKLCAYTTHTSAHCGQHYQLENLPDNELLGLGRLWGVNVHDTDSRDVLLSKIYAFKMHE